MIHRHLWMVRSGNRWNLKLIDAQILWLSLCPQVSTPCCLVNALVAVHVAVCFVCLALIMKGFAALVNLIDAPFRLCLCLCIFVQGTYSFLEEYPRTGIWHDEKGVCALVDSIRARC